MPTARPFGLKHVGLVLPVLLLGMGFASCSSYFGHRIIPEGGWDRSGGDDEVYINARSVDGLPNGTSALVIPYKWSSQPTQEGTDGIQELVSPIRFTWLNGKKLPPELRTNKARRRARDQPDGKASLWGQILYKGSNPLEPFEDLQIHEYNAIHELLKTGQDAYVLAPLKQNFAAPDLRHGFEVYGAVGPPLQWVRLGEIQVKSDESTLAWVTTRTVGALAWGSELVLVPVSGVAFLALSVGLSPLMGPAPILMACESPFGGHFPPTPW